MPDQPSLRHQTLAWLVPRLRRASEVSDPDAERERVLTAKQGRRAHLPTWAVPGFAQRCSLLTEDVEGSAGTFPAYSFAPRGVEPRRTVLYLHGGGYVYGIDPFQVRYAATLSRALAARVVMPAYPTAPEHDWRASRDGLLELAQRLLGGPTPVSLLGDSAGGGLALALAQQLRDRAAATGARAPDRMVLHAPWVDLSLSAPETNRFAARDPWLFPGKARLWGSWWAGRPEDLIRPEVSPAFGDLDGLAPTLMFCGTRDMLAAGCRQLADRAVSAEWDLTYLERPELIHVFGLLPGIPEARTALRLTVRFLA